MKMVRLWFLDSRLQPACLGHFSHEIRHCFSKFCGFPCNFKQVSLVCHLLQWSRHIFALLPHAFFEIPWPPILEATLAATLTTLVTTNVEFSWIVEEESPIMTNLWLSSFWTSENTYWIEGKDFLPRICPQTSSNSLFSLTRSSNTCSFSLIFLKQTPSAAHTHSNP